MRQAKLRNVKRRGEQGSILATSALGMLSIILAVGLGVDISRFYLAKTELQNAADAAALAGVSALNSSAAGITEATNRAVKAMNNYDFNHKVVSFPRENVLFAKNLDGPYVSEAAAKASPKDIRFVQVTTPPSPIGVSFAVSVLGSSRDLAAMAIAGYSVPLNQICGWLPISVIDYDVPMTPGQTYTIRSSPGDMVSPGNYQLLSVMGRGADEVREGLAGGVNLCAEPGATYEVDTEPGLSAGAVRAGFNTRFDKYSAGLDPTIYPPDTNIKENITHDEYLNGTATQSPNNTGVVGRRIGIIPIIKYAEYDQGRNTVTFDRFGVFFLQTSIGGGSGGELVAEYIDDIVVGVKGGYNPNGGPTNSLLAVPVLYR